MRSSTPVGAIGSESRLRRLLAILFVGLAIPAAVLIRQGFVQLDLEEFRRQQLIAESVVRRVDADLSTAVAVENARPFADFEFARSNAGSALRSPLSSTLLANAFPGAIGYFQVDAAGTLSTPLLPESNEQEVDLGERELEARRAIESQVEQVLEANRLVRAAASSDPVLEQQQQQGQQGQPAQPVGARRRGQVADADSPQAPLDTAIRGQARFDELASLSFADAGNTAEAQAVSESAPAAVEEMRDLGVVSVADMVGGDLEPYRFSRLESGHLVLFRNAWQGGQRFIQGVLIDPDAFIAASHRAAFANSGFAPGTHLDVTAADSTIATLWAAAPRSDDAGTRSALYSARLSPPLAEIALSFSIGRLPRGPGFDLLVWTSIVLAGVLIGGFLLMYRFGAEQLRLARQQQNFVSAVSHELKTPLTSIRMYGEMLKSGWADEQKKQSYYDFILAEGERLSRLIDNVLQLARLNRNGAALAPERATVDELFDVLRSRLSGQAEQAGFALEFEREPAVGSIEVSVDCDALTQVFINLVDNALKFARDAAQRRIVIAARQLDRAELTLSVRDFGPGIREADMKRLFELFYRPDNELTRATAGTGIGLALVQQLVAAMDGRVDVRNMEPGAEIRVLLPIVTGAAA